MSDFANRAVRNSGHRAPKRDAVRERWDDITAALRAGASVDAIYRMLKADSADVGSLSSFKGNVRTLRSERGITPQPASSAGADNRRESTIPNGGHNLADSRFKSDY